MTPERYQRIQQVLQRRQPDLTLLTDEVHKARNLSAIVRNCDAVGIAKMHCVIPDKDYKSYKGTAKGSHDWVEVVRHKTIEDALCKLKAQGFRLIGAHVGPGVVDYQALDYCQPTAFVMGAEKLGLSEVARQTCDAFVTIPMSGMVASYNVSVASGILLNEAHLQRLKCGHYAQRKLSDSEYQCLLFECLHPKIARYCQRFALDYPCLREDGEIDEPAAWYQSVRQARQQ